ncbi:MAG TPA: hypothetical protein VH912_19335 [Streptosporangiaceae bacterium]
MAKKYAMYAGVAFVLFYVVKSPEGAAQVVHSAAGGLASAADSLARFVNALA